MHRAQWNCCKDGLDYVGHVSKSGHHFVRISATISIIMTPRHEAPCGHHFNPNDVQSWPKTAQDGPKTAQDGPRRPKAAPSQPKMGSR